MDTLTIEPLHGAQQIDRTAKLAGEIWREHYGAILEPGQIEYMLQQFQSPAAIARQIEEGYRYFLLKAEGRPAGYLAVKPEGERLFLSKLYMAKECRRRGFASQALEYLCGLCKRDGHKTIYLTVNKRNHGSIAAYGRLGFSKAREQTADIGNGYVMDDYIMERQV
ncbi:MAG: GNAT family N-acetyltransferase [Clostridiales bacterium]|nr:GNAT family N-acetyltransferase [Clostridiales bacterium]